jgi:ubiquinone/menaquinone biosynthesis C-methylase UbiE
VGRPRCSRIARTPPAARTRAEREGTPASFILANAQDHAFAPASFDMIISRFGVMFFDDFVQAFTNLRRAAKDDYRCLLDGQRPSGDAQVGAILLNPRSRTR